MSRWWADPVQSKAILALVDDSDVEQGVGTAVLGYHGIAAGALEPLTRRTLMDVSAVRHALAGVDLEPVAKALASATRPIMGDASERYGRLMASDLHKRATESTERLLSSMTNAGMAWPTAIERVATVHGVPSERLGQAAAKLSAPAVTPLVRADVGDRALMEYAMHMGLRENTLEDVTKAAQEQFDPKEHPRGAGGRFVDAPDRAEPDSERLERMARVKRGQARRVQRGARAGQANARRAQAEEAAAEERGGILSLFDAARGLFGRATDKPQQLGHGQQAVRRKMAAAQQGKRAEAQQGNVTQLMPKQQQWDEKGLLTDPMPLEANAYRVFGERFALVPKTHAQELRDTEFTLGRLEQQMGHAVEFMNRDALDAELARYNPFILADYAIVRIDGEMPTLSGGPREAVIALAPSARMAQTDAAMITSFDGFTYQHSFEIEYPPEKPEDAHPEPYYNTPRRVPMPMLDLRVTNAEEYPEFFDDGPPLPHDRGIHSRPEADVIKFQEYDVRRDSRGRFADEPDSPSPGEADYPQRIERQDRRKRKRRRRIGGFQSFQQAQAAQAQQFADTASLLESMRMTPDDRKEAMRDTAAQVAQKAIRRNLVASSSGSRAVLRQAQQRGEHSVAEEYVAFLTPAQEQALKAIANAPPLLEYTDPDKFTEIQNTLASITFGYGGQALKDHIKAQAAAISDEGAVQAQLLENQVHETEEAAEAAFQAFLDHAEDKHRSGEELNHAEELALRLLDGDSSVLLRIQPYEPTEGAILPTWTGAPAGEGKGGPKGPQGPVAPAARPLDPRKNYHIPVLIDLADQPAPEPVTILSADKATAEKMARGEGWPDLVRDKGVKTFSQVVRDSNVSDTLTGFRDTGAAMYRANFGHNEGDRL